MSDRRIIQQRADGPPRKTAIQTFKRLGAGRQAQAYCGICQGAKPRQYRGAHPGPDRLQRQGFMQSEHKGGKDQQYDRQKRPERLDDPLGGHSQTG